MSSARRWHVGRRRRTENGNCLCAHDCAILDPPAFMGLFPPSARSDSPHKAQQARPKRCPIDEYCLLRVRENNSHLCVCAHLTAAPHQARMNPPCGHNQGRRQQHYTALFDTTYIAVHMAHGHHPPAIRYYLHRRALLCSRHTGTPGAQDRADWPEGGSTPERRVNAAANAAYPHN